jgi:YfiH family protein
MAFPAGWTTPDWPVPANVRSVCTTRAGGISLPPYDALNLGDHVGDTPHAVATNRKIFSEAIAAKPVFLKQVHGRSTVMLDAQTLDGTEADGCVTTVSRVACTMMVADCLPVLFATEDGRAVGAAHAGWRGLAGEGGQGVLESAAECLRRASGTRETEILAWLGPCIGPDAFEVGPEVKATFVAHDAAAAEFFKPHGSGKWLADLQGLARRRLQAMGITLIFGNDGGREWCTVANPSRFFSHRRDRISGRLAASVWRT